MIMSTAESWDLVVPEDDAELGAELRRHGVRPGQRLWVVEPDENQTVDREQWQRAIARATAAAAALSSISDRVAEDLRNAIAPHLDALQAVADQAAESMPRIELSDATRTALADLAQALDEALRASKASNAASVRDPDPDRPRRRLRFTGMIDGPSDLSTRTDKYLAQGFGRD